MKAPKPLKRGQRIMECPKCHVRFTLNKGQEIEGHMCPGNQSKPVPGRKWIDVSPDTDRPQ